MYNRQLEKSRQNLIKEVKKSDLPKISQDDIIRALKKMDVFRMFRKHQQDFDMDFQIFHYLKENCHKAFDGMEEEDVNYYLREIVYNAIPELLDI